MKKAFSVPIPFFFSAYRDLPRPMWVLFGAQTVNRMGDFVFPFMALLLTRKMGMDEAGAGTWVMAMMAAMTFGAIASGKLSDHLGRKKVLLVFQGSSACLVTAAGFLGPHAALPWLLLASTFFVGAVRPVFSAVINDLCDPADRKKGFSLNYLGINLGASIGPLAAGFLFEHRLSWLFWADGLTTFAALFLVQRFVPESKPSCGDGAVPLASGEEESAESAVVAFFKRGVLWRYCAIYLLMNFVYGQSHFGLPLQTARLFGDRGSTVFGWLMSFNAVTVLACTAAVTKLFLRAEPLRVIGIAAILYAFGFGLNFLRLPLPLLFGSTLVWTLGEILFSTNNGAFIASHTPRNQRGRFQSIIQVFTGTGHYLSPLVAGLVIRGFGLGALWAVTAAVALAAAFAYSRLAVYERRSRAS